MQHQTQSSWGPPLLRDGVDFIFEKLKSFGEKVFIRYLGEGDTSMWGGGNDNGNWKRERQVRSKQTLCFNFFSRKVIFTFKFLEDTVFTFTSLVLKEDNLNSSVSISNFRDFYYFVLIYYYILFVVCFYKISFFHSNNQSLKLSEFVSLWAWIRDHSFMFAQRGRGLTKFWATLQMIVDGFWGERYFSDPFDIHTYKQQSLFSITH